MHRPSFGVLAASLVVLNACSEQNPVPTQARSAPARQLASTSSTSTTPVTSTVADTDAATASTLQIRSDGLGPYRSSSTLISEIQSLGDWELDSYTPRNGTRTIYLDFSRPIAASGPNGGAAIPIPSVYYRVHAISKCSLYNNSFFAVAPGVTINCPMHIGDVYVGSQRYAVQMNPRLSSADTAFAETKWVNVTCTSNGAGACTSWSMTPSATSPDGWRSNVAALQAYVTSGSKGKTTTTIVKQGDF
jgi:hypothetical protein